MILLDSDVISHLLRPAPPAQLAERVHAVPLRNRYLSAISIAEILYGIERTGQREHIRMILETRFIARVEVLPFDLEAARVFGRVNAYLSSAGTPLAAPDLCIAATALSRDLTLITGNESHFRRIPGLKIENWLR
jgi:tRNA(fMet)-specific endonuclease VapC